MKPSWYSFLITIPLRPSTHLYSILLHDGPKGLGEVDRRVLGEGVQFESHLARVAPVLASFPQALEKLTDRIIFIGSVDVREGGREGGSEGGGEECHPFCHSSCACILAVIHGNYKYSGSDNIHVR